MVNGSGSISVNQSVWERFKNVPSQLVGWFYGKFVTVSTKIKRVLFSDDSVLSAGQPVSTTIGDRTVSTTSSTHTQETPSLVTSSASYVITPSVGDASHAEASNHLIPQQSAVTEPLAELTKGDLLDICKGNFQSVKDDILIFISALEKKMGGISKANHDRFISIFHLNPESGFDDGRFLQIADELKIKESVVRDRQKMSPSEKIKLLTDHNAAKCANDKHCFSSYLQLIRFNRSRLTVMIPEYEIFAARICASCQPNSTELASKEDVAALREMVRQLDQIVSAFENGQVRDQIAQNGSLESKVSGIRIKLEDLTQLITASNKTL